jgi:prepilin-type processing-associated H-X9-DG protein
VDQGPLFDQVDFNKNLPAAEDQKFLQTHLPIYRCPSDTTSTTNPMRGNYGTSNYSGNHGSLSLPRWTTGRQTAFWPGQVETPKKANGIMYWNSIVRLRDITDGASNTFMVGERCVTSASGIWPGVGSNEFENDAVSECSHASRPNRGPTSFSSAHPGGVQFLLCDGSVNFINDEIDSKPISEGDLGTYQRLANRHDGLPVGDF